MLFDDNDTKTVQSNVPEFSVSELAFSLKRTVEEVYGRVRVRGEISRVSIPKSGHMYTSLKDDKAVIDAVCWKGVLSKLSIRPEEGLEVICTGKMTTYPGNSRYQLIIDSMELAGEGALLKMLEERKKKLAAEGLFDPERKKSLPFLPDRIGVVTSPTGAVIRDILHRLADRFPRDVILWPVKVQGEGADKEITEAIQGFNTLSPDLRPDIIIVARGGGSLEDLMPFNEEIVVRAASESSIPIISAVGHETDTTLIDYVADKRAPTPTGAAEMAVPVRLNLLAQVADNEKRLLGAASRYIQGQRQRIDALSAKLGDPTQILELKTQHVDRKSEKLEYVLTNILNRLNQRLTHSAGKLVHPKQMLENKTLIFESLSSRTHSAFAQYLANQGHKIERTSSRLRAPTDRIRTENKNLTRAGEQLERTGQNLLTHAQRRLSHITEKLELLSFENVLARGYVVIRGENNSVITQADSLSIDQAIKLQFKDRHFVGASVTKPAQRNTEPPASKTPPETKNKPRTEPQSSDQGSLF